MGLAVHEEWAVLIAPPLRDRLETNLLAPGPHMSGSIEQLVARGLEVLDHVLYATERAGRSCAVALTARA
jgi:hypothetical protein